MIHNYFTKWIGVNRPLTYDDRVVITGPGRSYGYKTEKKPIPAKMIDVAKSKGFLPAELHVCTYNIEVGDLVFVPDQEVAGNVIDTADLEEWKAKQAYKVLGTVPESCTWILGEHPIPDEDILVKPMYNRQWVEDFDEPVTLTGYWIRIKGPCGHFH